MARTFTRGPRRTKEWRMMESLGPTGFTSPATSTQMSLAFVEAVTVLRMIGEYIVGSTSAPAAGDNASIGVGIGVGSTDSVAAGALPEPDDEGEYPWLYYANHPLIYTGTAPETGQGTGALRHKFDIRSMRKIKPRESLYLVAQYSSSVGNPPVTFFGQDVRVLLALA